MSDYPWENGVFNPACVCGGSINRVNDDCERCAMHDWIYKQADEIEKLREERDEAREAATDDHNWRGAVTNQLVPNSAGDISRGRAVEMISQLKMRRVMSGENLPELNEEERRAMSDGSLYVKAIHDLCDARAEIDRLREQLADSVSTETLMAVECERDDAREAARELAEYRPVLLADRLNWIERFPWQVSEGGE